MILTQNIIANTAIWIVHIISIIGISSQILLNYKIKSTNGLSNTYISIYLFGYLVHLLYIFCLDLPTAYKIMAPISSFLVLIIVFQHYHYKKYKTTNNSIKLYCINFSIIFLLFSLSSYFSNKIGHFAGWISFIIWTIYQVPQVFRIHSKKSISGFSFTLVSINGIQSLLSLIATFTLGVPLQSVFSGLRGLIFFAIFCFQFWLYKKRPKPNIQKNFLCKTTNL